MSNRFNKNSRGHSRLQTSLEKVTWLPHGTRLRMKKQRLRDQRVRNLASASRHLFTLQKQCEEGVIVEERGRVKKITLVRKNPYRAELFGKTRAQTIQLAESLGL